MSTLIIIGHNLHYKVPVGTVGNTKTLNKYWINSVTMKNLM